MLLIIIGCLAGASVMLVMSQFKSDPQMRTIEERILSEVADEPDRPRSWLVKMLEPLVRFNVRMRLYHRSSFIDETILAGKVPLTGGEFFAIKQCAAVGACVVYWFILSLGRPQFFWLIISPLIGWNLPVLWLKQRVAARHHSITRDLPEIVDLLALCVDAGADFMGSMNRIAREYRPCAIRDELAVVLQEIRIGKRRRDAFRSMARRIKLADVNAFTRAIVQADRMGVGMAGALRIMAEDTRLRRYHAAERFAQQAPLKMLLPLILIMMTALIMVTGPILLEFTKGQMFPKI